ncbi:hypothetical protein PAPHI01_1333 [Pancytospora philotis]|nr:hypothetical protein PAPHI01_1333 [Pancytospora philotis]
MAQDFFAHNVSAQRPGARSAWLFGTQYSTDELSYIEFCRVYAANEEPREYVCPGREDMEVERVGGPREPLRKIKQEGPDDKPQDSYAYMIYRALESSKSGRLTLAEIYAWIESTYPFYRTADPVWKNSIRHNLSLNAAFKKIPRPKCSKGKGGYWAIDEEAKSVGKVMKRRKPAKEQSQPLSKIITENDSKLIF